MVERPDTDLFGSRTELNLKCGMCFIVNLNFRNGLTCYTGAIIEYGSLWIDGCKNFWHRLAQHRTKVSMLKYKQFDRKQSYCRQSVGLQCCLSRRLWSWCDREETVGEVKQWGKYSRADPTDPTMTITAVLSRLKQREHRKEACQP